MNKTQKNAWFNLVGAVLVIALGIHSIKTIAKLFSTGSVQNPIQNLLLWGLFILGYVVLGAIFLRAKQSPAEVEADERDSLIKKRAALVAFVSVWILLMASYLILWFTLGLGASIPIFVLPFIYIAIFYIVVLIWSIATLIQYGWKKKGDGTIKVR